MSSGAGPPGHALPEGRRLLLLAPSSGFGGGIERVADAIALAWSGGPVSRVDLYRPEEVAMPEGAPLAKLQFIGRTLAVASRRPPEVVVVLHVNLLPVALLLRTFRPVRVVTFGHGTEVWERCPWWKRRLMRRSRLLAVSSFTAHWMARRARLDVRGIRVVPLAVDQALVEELSSNHPSGVTARDEAPCLLTVCRFAADTRYKGAFDVAEALPSVLAERPDLRWIVVGHGPDLPALRHRCESLGVGGATEFRGSVSNRALADAYRRADVFVLPSRARPEAVPPIGEGFGLVFAEAGAFGVPSIASSVGGGSLEFVIHEQTGLNVPPDDPEALARAILRLIDDEGLRARLGQAASELAQSRHRMAHFAATIREACA